MVLCKRWWQHTVFFFRDWPRLIRDWPRLIASDRVWSRLIRIWSRLTSFMKKYLSGEILGYISSPRKKFGDFQQQQEESKKVCTREGGRRKEKAKSEPFFCRFFVLLLAGDDRQWSMAFFFNVLPSSPFSDRIQALSKVSDSGWECHDSFSFVKTESNK